LAQKPLAQKPSSVPNRLTMASHPRRQTTLLGHETTRQTRHIMRADHAGVLPSALSHNFIRKNHPKMGAL
jgi:hypothetical protein